MATKQSRPILLQDDRSGVREDFGRQPPRQPLRTVTTRRPHIVKHDRIALLSWCLACAIITTVEPSPAPITASDLQVQHRECLGRLARTWYGDLDPKSEKIEDVTPFVDASTNLMPFLDTASLITTRSVLGSSPASTPRRRPSTPPEVDESPGLDSVRVRLD